MKRDLKAFFTAEDFEESRCDCSPYVTKCKCNTWPSREIAKRANAIFTEWLGAQVVMEVSQTDWGWFGEQVDELGPQGRTHTARLVAIEEKKK